MRVFRYKELFSDSDTVTVQYNRNSDCEKHTHEFFEFVYVADGEGTHEIDGKTYNVKRGSLMFINFGQQHEFSVRGGAYYNVLLLPEYIGTGLARETQAVEDLFSLVLSAGDGNQCVGFSGGEIEDVENILKMLYSEFCGDGKKRKEAVSDLVHLLIIRILRKVNSRGEENKPTDKISEVLSYLKSHYADNPSLSYVSEKFYYNSSYFSRMFKRFTGAGFNAYVNSLKIDEALNLLENTELSVEEIAQNVGYGDAKSFYAQFKRSTGLTPKAFRASKKPTR